MRNIVVTGATSMLGVALIRKAIEKNIHVLAIVRRNSVKLTRIPRSELIEIIECNVEDLSDLSIPSHQYDVFYHLAWEYTEKAKRDNVGLQMQNITSTISAVETAHKIGCKRFIGAGSQAEFGPQTELIKENTICNPVMAYGIAKYSSSMMAKRLCEQFDIECIWPRICSVYGYNDNPNSVISYAISCFRDRKKAYFSSGNQLWNYIFEEDAGEMLLRFGNCLKLDFSPLVASSDNKQLKQFILEIARSYSCKDLCCFQDTNLTEQLYGLNVDATQTFKAIDYVPSTSFTEGITSIEVRLNNGI